MSLKLSKYPAEWNFLEESFAALVRVAGGPMKSSCGEVLFWQNQKGEFIVSFGGYCIGEWSREETIGPFKTEEEALKSALSKLAAGALEVAEEEFWLGDEVSNEVSNREGPAPTSSPGLKGGPLNIENLKVTMAVTTFDDPRSEEEILEYKLHKLRGEVALFERKCALIRREIDQLKLAYGPPR